MKKRILLIGYNYAPEPTGVGKYSGEMIEWLANNGYDCTVVTAYPYYPFWQVQDPYRKKRFWYSKENKKFSSGGEITTYRCPMYVPRKPSGKKRIILDFSFLISAFLQLLAMLPGRRHDLVISVAPSFQIGFLGGFFSKLSKAKHLYHIQDLQIEVAREFNLIKSPKLLGILFKMENYIFKNTDVVSSISEGMVAKIEEKSRKETLLFPNWANNEMFFPISSKDKLKQNYGFEPTDKVILYSGAIGEKQGLESILETAQEFKDDKRLKFAICGSGPYKTKLEQMADKKALNNVRFFPLQPLEKFNAFLNMADVHLVIQKSKASDLVMPSKMTTILAIGGLALITANENSSLHKLVNKYQMGHVVPTENQEALNEGLKKVLYLEDTTKICRNALKYSDKYLSINNVMQSFEKSVLRHQVSKVTQQLVE